MIEKSLLATLAIGLVWAGESTAPAQGYHPTPASAIYGRRDSSPQRSSPKDNDKSLIDQVGDMGRSLIGGILPKRSDLHAETRVPAAAPSRRVYTMQPRAGSVAGRTAGDAGEFEATQPPTASSSIYRARPTERISSGRAAAPSTAERRAIVTREPIATRRSPLADSAADSPRPSARAGSTRSTRTSLHERLNAFRNSAFDMPSDSQRETQVNVQQSPALSDRAMPEEPAVETPAIADNAPTPALARRVEPVSDDSAHRLAAPLGVAAGVAKGREVLFEHKSPILDVQTFGPRKISVGKQSTYAVAIRNRGEVGADEVVVRISLPEWADVLGTEPTAGTPDMTTDDGSGRVLRWTIPHMPADGRERLVLQIIPRESRPFDLAVRWDYQPVASQAMIEVQEPKLAISVDGPSEVLYGEDEIFKLQIANEGTGAAENLILQLMPLGSGGIQPVTHPLGTLAAGKQKTLELELTARQIGDLEIQIEVRGDNGVRAELAEQVFVRRAALQIEIDGPGMQYVGGVAGYRIQVSNPGTAAAENVDVAVNLPAGAKYVSGVDDARQEAGGSKVAWTVEYLAPGEKKDFNLQCSLGLPGAARMDVISTAPGDLTATAGATTRVEAIADLAMEVKDPAGPVPVGQEAVYEMTIHNRGTKHAENVDVVAYFSEGIEPRSAEGAQYRLASGQVAFNAIPTIAAGGKVVLKIRATATESGNHIFRAEVHCKPLDLRLVSEETTRYYRDTPSAERAIAGSQPSQADPAAVAPIRTADQRQSAVPPRENPSPTPNALYPSESMPRRPWR